MLVGYFLNVYPGTSMTFIRTEINALEADGVTVARYAIRRSPDPLVTEADRREQTRTRYILDLRGQLALRLLAEIATNPLGFARAFAAMLALLGSARTRPIAHCAYLIEAIVLKAWCRADGVTHLHTHFSTNSAAVAMLCRRLGGPRYSFTAHGPNEFYTPERTRIPDKVRHAAFVACISEYCQAKVHEIAGAAARDKTHVVRCGIDLSMFEPEPPPGGDAPLVCVGRLCPEKAQTVLVQAVARIAPRHPGLNVQLVGDGECRAEIEAMIRAEGLEDHVALLGWRSHAQVRALIAGARALVLPSFAEGLPIVLMEAMALGRPVVTTRITGIPELVTRDTGWLVEPGDAAGLAEALDAVLTASDTEMAARAAAGRARVADLHDSTKNARRLRDLIESAMAEAPA